MSSEWAHSDLCQVSFLWAQIFHWVNNPGKHREWCDIPVVSKGAIGSQQLLLTRLPCLDYTPQCLFSCYMRSMRQFQILFVFRNLRTPSNFFILNLSLTDLLVGTLLVFQIPYRITGVWNFGADLCKVIKYFPSVLYCPVLISYYIYSRFWWSGNSPCWMESKML